MTDSLLFRLQNDKARAMEETLESWKADHAGAMQARDVEELVREALLLPTLMRRIYREVTEDLKTHPTTGYDSAGRAMKALFERNLDFMKSVLQMARAIEASGHSVEGLAELRAAYEELRPKVTEIFERWPWLPTPEEVAEARAEYARGEYNTAEEILNELRRKGK